MTKILSIDNQAGTVLVNLLDDNATCVFFGEGGTRPLKSGPGLITRTFIFRTTASTKALARTAANTFIASLRKAIDWGDDILESNSIFLREAADGETAVRSLIVNFDANAITDGSAIDAYQTMNKELYIAVAITLQNHREEPSKTTLTTSGESSAVAVGRKVTLSGGNNTADSRIFVTLTSSLVGNFLTKYWVGLMPRTASDWLHLWYTDYYSSLGTNATETTDTNSYGTNIVSVSFSSVETMAPRVFMEVADQYTAQGVTHTTQAKGRYVALLRYRVSSGTGSILVRGGVASSDDADVSYNEPVLIDASGNWRLLSLGLIQFPINGARYEQIVDDIVSTNVLVIDAQRLSGTAVLSLDTVTFIPHDHYLHVSEGPLSSIYDASIVTNEDFTLNARSITVATGNYKRGHKIADVNNFKYPKSDDGNVQMVYAASLSTSHSASINIENDDVQIYEAYEAYNV